MEHEQNCYLNLDYHLRKVGFLSVRE